MTRSCKYHIQYRDNEYIDCSHLGNVPLSTCGGCKLFELMRSPNLLEKMGTFTKASAKHLANGMKTVGSEEEQRRKAICTYCQLFDPAEETCRHCGCSIPTKITWDSERCPLGKW